MAPEHKPVIILGVEIHWIASTLWMVCIHLWSQNAGKGILEAHILKFFPGGICPCSFQRLNTLAPLALVGAAMPLLKSPFLG